MKDFAFVHFKERDDAISSMKIMNGNFRILFLNRLFLTVLSFKKNF